MKKRFIAVISILTSLCIFSERFLKDLILSYKRLNNLSVSKISKVFYSNTDFLLLFFVTIAFFFFYNKYKDLKRKTGYTVLGCIFSLFLVVGFSYRVAGDSSLIIGNILMVFLSIIKFILYSYFFSTILNILSEKIKKHKKKDLKIPKFLIKFKNYYEAHPYKTTILVLLIAWLPYIISFYPGILSPDPANQIKQYYNVETHYITGVNLIDENVLITNHHPVFHTFILGGFTKIGDLMGSFNFGIFLFTCFQLFVVISALTYALVYLKKEKVSFFYRFLMLCLFAFVPVFPLYVLSPVKDTMFGALLIFYIIEIHKLLTKQYRKRDYLGLCLLILIMMLIRNNGIYIILLSLPFVLIFIKEKKLPVLIVLLLSIFIYEGHNKILLPAMHITEGSIREMLSVPFQQTARYVKYYGEEITEKERQVIDTILDYDTLAERYKPNISDPVKNKFNKDATKEDLISYFKFWSLGFIKHPIVYVDATMNTIYGYFYPNTSNWYIYFNYDEILAESGFDYHYNNLSVLRNALSGIGLAHPYIPVLGAIVNIGFIVWTYLYLLTYLIVEKKRKWIMLLLPAFALLLTIIVGPVNTYFRYVFPMLVSLPLVLGLIFKETLKKE